MNPLEKYKQYLGKKPDELFGEPFWLPLPFDFPAPAAVNTRKQFFTKTHSHDLLVVGCITQFINPFQNDTPTRAVPELEVEIKDAQGNLFIRDTAPLYAIASHLFAPELWHEYFVIPRNTSLEVDLIVKRSPTVVNTSPQSIEGELVFKCIRFQRIAI
jgi:hypothetical protein